MVIQAGEVMTAVPRNARWKSCGCSFGGNLWTAVCISARAGVSRGSFSTS